MKKYALRQVRINDRDRKVFEALYRFNGITLGALQEVHFNGSSYASNRLAKLKNAGYLDRKYYYSDGLKEAGVYYLCSKGIQEIGKEITPKYIEPRKDKLDVQIMLSKLYCKFSDDLLSAREVKQVYNLQNFTPISAFLPSPPTAIIILSHNSTSQEYNNVKTFLEAQVEPFVQYIVVAKKFPGVLEETDAHFIYWDMAEQVIPNFYRNPQHYTNSFLKVFQNYFPNTPITVKNSTASSFTLPTCPSAPLPGRAAHGLPAPCPALTAPRPCLLPFSPRPGPAEHGPGGGRQFYHIFGKRPGLLPGFYPRQPTENQKTDPVRT